MIFYFYKDFIFKSLEFHPFKQFTIIQLRNHAYIYTCKIKPAVNTLTINRLKSQESRRKCR